MEKCTHESESRTLRVIFKMLAVWPLASRFSRLKRRYANEMNYSKSLMRNKMVRNNFKIEWNRDFTPPLCFAGRVLTCTGINL